MKNLPIVKQPRKSKTITLQKSFISPFCSCLSTLYEFVCTFRPTNVHHTITTITTTKNTNLKQIKNNKFNFKSISADLAADQRIFPRTVVICSLLFFLSLYLSLARFLSPSFDFLSVVHSLALVMPCHRFFPLQPHADNRLIT